MSESPSMLVLTCTCGQKMKIPVDATGRTFKCVRCAAHIKSSEENAVPLPSEPPEGQPGFSEQSDTPPAHAPIGQLLIDAGIITEVQLQDALNKQRTQGGKTFELLIALGHLDKDKLHDVLSRQPGIATIDLARFEIAPDLIELVPKKLAVESLVLPIDRLGKLLTVAMACPLDTATITLLERTTGLRVKAMLCKLEDIHAAVQRYYPDRSQFELTLSSFDNMLDTTKDSKERVNEKVAAWDGVFLGKERLNVLREAVASESSLSGVARLVLEEPSLGAFLMRVANSDIYGVPGQIESIPMAVVLLGKAGVLGVLGELVEPVSPKVLEPLGALFQRSRLTATVAQGLAREGGVVGEHAACSLGMLGELGRLALLSISPTKYKRVKSHLYGAELLAAEQKLFSMDHAVAAGVIAERWRFPKPLSKALRHYIEPEEAEEAEALARLLNLSLALSYTGDDARKALFADQKSSLAALKLDANTAMRVVNGARASLADASEKD
ncbi:MAG: HDOD domain-containing protein [Candidatus Hydrogenedentes bacterium]|nr:HDOD domain-containing protein [Candidatus Hydrogenedentota bacterium]